MAEGSVPAQRWSGLGAWPLPPIEATRAVPMAAERLFALLSDIRNHWPLIRGLVEPVRADGPHHSEVRVRGPLGLRRTARAGLLVGLDPHFLIGSAEIGRYTVMRVCWALVPGRGTTEVELSALATSAGTLARLLLALGGRRWLARRLDAVLGELAGLATLADEGVATGGGAGAWTDNGREASGDERDIDHLGPGLPSPEDERGA
jgi:hypothetical protein